MNHDVFDRRFARTISSKSLEELRVIREAIEADPKNRNSVGIQLYTKPARAKLNAIAYTITAILEESRKSK